MVARTTRLAGAKDTVGDTRRARRSLARMGAAAAMIAIPRIATRHFMQTPFSLSFALSIARRCGRVASRFCNPQTTDVGFVAEDRQLSNRRVLLLLLTAALTSFAAPGARADSTSWLDEY